MTTDPQCCGHRVSLDEDCPACDEANRESDAVPERDEERITSLARDDEAIR